MNLNASIPEHESRKLILLGSLFLAVPLIWGLFLGWHPAELIPQQDHVHLGIIYMRELTRAAGDWHSLMYWPGLGGGVKVHDVTGSLPIAQLLAWLGSPPLIMANLQVMFVQIIFAYLCVCCSLGILREVYSNDDVIPWQLEILAGITFAFLPVISWRITHGHDSIIVGLYVLLCFTALFLDEMSRKRSVTTIVLCVITLCHTFQFNGFQLVHYSILFGAPIVLGLMFMKPGLRLTERIAWYWLPVLVFLAALLISLPKLYGILLNGFGDDSSRAAGGYNVIYSYTVAELSDWLSSLPWAADYLPEARKKFTHHEINYPFGPLVLLVLLSLSGHRLLRFGAGMLISLVMVLIVSMNLEPLSKAIVAAVPLLDSFRVPARSMIPFLVFLSILSVAALLNRSSRSDYAGWPEWGVLVAAGAAFVAIGFSPPIINDGILILAVLALLFLRQKVPVQGHIIVMALFAGGAVAAFKQRAYEPLVDPITDAGIATFRADIFQQEPALRSPLNRAQVNVQHESIGINTGFFLDVSSLTSYWFPLSRYAQLVAAMEGIPYHPTLSVFFRPPESPAFEPMNRLYNVAWVLNPGPRGVAVSQGNETFGAAWLSGNVDWHDSWASLADGVKRLKYKGRLLLLDEDPRITFKEESFTDCQISRDVSTTSTEFPFEFELGIEGQCYLTVAMNYSSILKAEDQNGRILRTFPAYGALLGVLVDSDTKRISVEPVVSTFPGATIIQLLGFLLAGGIVVFVSMRGSRR
ncbi:MAG: hypothetical protein HOC70_10320 [Gammaproteobacteria bacterium]|nr:hypothetical protein [Gammaproteobacteria bacterium]MBT4493629.1 hypothetical protein [Gammaproteobacteria bacterium]MBT7370099.1 hypothetical protein [Gammaproteobacteria bacterium]